MPRTRHGLTEAATWQWRGADGPRDMEDATIQSMLGLLQSWEATPDASPDSELNRALAVGWALVRPSSQASIRSTARP